jgi:3-oxoacyl-[acyl-carrier protein] reductase
MSGRFADRVAVVTGGAYGIGEGIARRLAGEGARVAVVDIAGDVATTVAAALPDAIAIRADVTVADDVEAVFRTVVAEFGGVDILVNNAGGAVLPPQPFWEMTEDQWDFVVDLNLKSQWLMAKAAAPLLQRRPRAKIINISSVNGLNGNPGLVAYCAAKAGVVIMTRTMAAELGPWEICVNAIAPGFIRFTHPKSVFTAEQVEVMEKWAISAQMIKRLGQPEHIAGAVAFLASADGDHVTGQIFSVDAGGSPFGTPG